jgi:hypothetical protein
MVHAAQPVGAMIETLVTFVKALADPLRNTAYADRWIAQLPTGDAMEIQKEALELVATYPGARKEVGVAQVEALLRIDARLEPVIAQLIHQYVTNYQKSSAVESRLWHAVFDLVKAFVAAYHASLMAGFPRAENKRWRAVLPWVLVRLVHYKGLDGKYRLFRYSHWIPAQWRDFHELYEFGRIRGWQREQLVFGAGAFARPGVSLEQVYMRALLLMRLDSGNFTPDQVEWAAQQLEDWTPSLVLVPPPGEGTGFYVDLTSAQGLRRRDRKTAGGRNLFLDLAPVYGRVVERMRWLPEQDDDAPQPGDLPPREQRLLLMRLAALFGPEAIAHAPRAVRHAIEGEARVVVGLPALLRAVAEIERLPDAARVPGVAASFDEVTQVMNVGANPESIARQVRGSIWRIIDRSDTGCRFVAPVKDAPTRLGELIALKEGDHWMLAVVRRMQRQHLEEVTVGVEVIARRVVRVMMRSWMAPSDAGRGEDERPFFGIYLPAHAANRQAAQRSLIGPEDKIPAGGMVELDTGNGRYLIRFSQTLERQAGWTWALFNAIRKLAS